MCFDKSFNALGGGATGAKLTGAQSALLRKASASLTASQATAKPKGPTAPKPGDPDIQKQVRQAAIKMSQMFGRDKTIRTGTAKTGDLVPGIDTPSIGGQAVLLSPMSIKAAKFGNNVVQGIKAIPPDRRFIRSRKVM